VALSAVAAAVQHGQFGLLDFQPTGRSDGVAVPNRQVGSSGPAARRSCRFSPRAGCQLTKWMRTAAKVGANNLKRNESSQKSSPQLSPNGHFKTDIEAYLREELVKLRTKQELLQDAAAKFQHAVLGIYEKHIGMERTAGMRAHGIQNLERQEKRDKCDVSIPRC
jgi:hypothetical protein